MPVKDASATVIHNAARTMGEAAADMGAFGEIDARDRCSYHDESVAAICL